MKKQYGRYEDEARRVCDAIRQLGTDPDKLDNLENYLAQRFGAWLIAHANSPDGMAGELAHFAGLD